MHVQVIRVGRKRKQGKRWPSGDIITAAEKVMARAIAISHPERQSVPAEERHTQRAGTPLGRMAIRGIVTDEQVEAGRRYAQDVRRYQQTIGCPKPSASAIDLLKVSGSSVVFSAEQVQERQNAYDAVFEHLEKRGHKCARAVARVAVYDERIPEGCTLDHLLRGLSALVDYYGLTTHRKSGYLGNRS